MNPPLSDFPVRGISALNMYLSEVLLSLVGLVLATVGACEGPGAEGDPGGDGAVGVGVEVEVEVIVTEGVVAAAGPA